MISEVEQTDGTIVRLEHDGSELALEHIERMRSHAIEARSLIADGVPALERLMPIAEHGETGQGRYVAAFLLGLYNGQRFPFVLTNLRGLDACIMDECLAVLRMDMKACQQEVHNYFDNGGERFEAIAERWGLK